MLFAIVGDRAEQVHSTKEASMTRAFAVSAFAAGCMLIGCNKSQPESEPAPAPAAAAAPAKDTTMAGGNMAADSTKMMTDTTKMAPADTTTMKMPADSTMSMPADTSKK